MKISDLLHGKRGEGRQLTSQPGATSGDKLSKRVEASAIPGGVVAVNANGESLAILQTGPAPIPAENTNPERRSINKKGGRRSRLIRMIKHAFIQPDPTPEERAQIAERERRKKMTEMLKEESLLYRKRITNALTRLNLCYRYAKSKNDLFMSGVKEVHFDSIVMSPDAIYLRVDTRRLPRGVSIISLTQEEVLTDLSLSCGRRISANFSEDKGMWYIVERASGVLGIPAHVKLADMLEQFPASADGLTIPLGLTSNSRTVFKSLSSMYSLLVGGTIGAGKSNILNVILCTLIRRNPPNRLKLLLVDLKGGLEFSFYEGIPHLMSIPEVAEGGIIYHRDKVPDALRFLLAEGERRIGILKAASCKEISAYNARHRNKKSYLPHLVFICDEYADVKLEHKLGAQVEDLLTNIAQRFRAVGIHVIICTQIPKTEIISTRIKGVLPAKIAFSCPNNQASMAILDNAHAKGLEPAGRAIFSHAAGEMMVQTPYISEQFIQATVTGAKAGGQYEDIKERHDVTIDEILAYALQNESGYLVRDRLYPTYKERGLTVAELNRWLSELDGKEVVVAGALYRVEPASGARPRRLIAAEVNNDQNK